MKSSRLPNWSLGLLIITIESFFVFVAMMANYRLMFVFMGLSLIILVVYSYLYNKLILTLNNFLILFLIFIIYITVRAIMTSNYVDIIFYWLGFIFLLLFTGCEKNIDFDKIWKFLLVLGVFFAIGVILQMLFTDQFMDYYYPLFADSYKDSIRRQVIYHEMYTGWTSQTFATSINLILGLYATWSLWLSKKKKTYIIYAIIMIIALLLTGKRGPLVFMIGAFVIVELWTSQNLKVVFKKIWRYILVFLIVLVFLLVALRTQINALLGGNAITRLTQSLNDVGDSDISNGRFVLWNYAWTLIKNRPIFGSGWRSFHILAATHLGEDIQTHNVFLQLWSEIGFIGIALFIIPIIYALIDAKRKFDIAERNGLHNKSIALEFSLMVQIFLLLYCLTGNVLYDFNALLMYYLSFAIYLVASRNIKASYLI